MHERTTRAIARWLFVGCCAAPTALTMLAILVTWTPWYHRRACRAIESQVALMTGLHIEIGNFERADPSTWRLSGVRLSNPETRRPIASVRSVEWISQREKTVILLSQPEIYVESLEHVAELLHRRFLCRPEQTRLPVRIAADDVTLRSGSAAQTIQDLDAWLETRENVVLTTVRCIPAGHPPDSEGIHIEVIRDRSNSPPTTAWSVQSGAVKLPLAVLSDYYPSVNGLGVDATFDGSVSGTLQDGITDPTWSLNLAGHFHNIDLGQLTQNLPHRVTGKATVSVDRCQLGQDGSVNVAGQLVAHEGWMSASLLPRLAEDLGCTLLVATADNFSFDALAFRFDLYASQLRVEGICRNLTGKEWLPAGVVVSAGGRAIVKSSDTWSASLNLTRLFAPAHSAYALVSAQTSGLLSFLRPPSHPLPLNGTAGGAPDKERILFGGQPGNDEPAARISRVQPRRDQTSPISQPR